MDNNVLLGGQQKHLPMFPRYLNRMLWGDWEASTWDLEAAIYGISDVGCLMATNGSPFFTRQQDRWTINWKIRGWSGMIITAQIDWPSGMSWSIFWVFLIRPSWTIRAIALSYWGNQAHQSLHKIRHDRAVLLAKSSKASNVMAPATCQLHILWCVRWTHDIGLREKPNSNPAKSMFNLNLVKK